MRLDTSEIAAITDGEASVLPGGGPDAGGVTVEGATIDSRAVPAGSLFVPVVADRDGHDFIEAAVAAVAVA